MAPAPLVPALRWQRYRRLPSLVFLVFLFRLHLLHADESEEVEAAAEAEGEDDDDDDEEDDVEDALESAQNVEARGVNILPLLAYVQPRLQPWTAPEYPDPRSENSSCGLVRHIGSGPMLCDPQGLITHANVVDHRSRLTATLGAFYEQLDPAVIGAAWGVRLGLAFLTESTTALPAFAAALAAQWGLDGGRGLLLVLRADGPPAAAIAGALRELLPAEAVAAAERGAAGMLADGQYVDAAIWMIRAVAEAESGTWLHMTDNQGIKIEQRMIRKWKSQYQEFEVWENSCGERRCLELFLEDVRQLSDRYEAYYHEAMTFPAIVSLGPERAKRVLVLGGGDGGIATYALKFASVERVLVVEIDEEVVRTSKDFFPAVAAGYDDPRCELLHVDAFKWVVDEAERSTDEFDVIIVDFTDEPVEGAWNEVFFRSLAKLLPPHGVLVQNVGTLQSGHFASLVEQHQVALKSVFLMSTYSPDYLSPYILAFTSDVTSPLTVHKKFYEEQGIVGKYYSPELHPALFIHPATTARVLGMGTSAAPTPPTEARINTLLLESAKQDIQDLSEFSVVTRKRKTQWNNLKIKTSPNCRRGGVEGCHAVFVNGDYHLGLSSDSTHESMALPALAMLGDRAHSVLLLGGGAGGVLRQVLKHKGVEKVVLVEVDQALIAAMAREKSKFPSIRAAYLDPRVEAYDDSAMDWLAGDDDGRRFDAVIVDLSDEPWLEATIASRVPRVRSFYRSIRDRLQPHGLVVQDIGSLATIRAATQLVDLHRSTFASTWVINFGGYPSNIEVLQNSDKYPLDCMLRRPPRLAAISSRSSLEDPRDVDWAAWERLAIPSTYYHASMHEAMFLLPTELHHQLSIPWPPARRGIDMAPGVTRAARSREGATASIRGAEL